MDQRVKHFWKYYPKLEDITSESQQLFLYCGLTTTKQIPYGIQIIANCIKLSDKEKISTTIYISWHSMVRGSLSQLVTVLLVQYYLFSKLLISIVQETKTVYNVEK